MVILGIYNSIYKQLYECSLSSVFQASYEFMVTFPNYNILQIIHFSMNIIHICKSRSNFRS